MNNISKDYEPGIMAFNGSTGEIVYDIILEFEVRHGKRWNDFKEENHDSMRITGLSEYSDINSDGIKELFVSTQRDLFILDGATGKNLHNWTSRPWEHGIDNDNMHAFEPAEHIHDMANMILGDINNDGIDDIVCLGNEKINVGLSKKYGKSIIFKNSSIYSFQKEHIDNRRVKVLDDRDGDGIKEIYFQRHRENSPPANTIFSVGKKKILLEISEHDLALKFLDNDYNGDGILDIVQFQRWSEQGTKLKMISGADNSIIWEYFGIKDGGGMEEFGLGFSIPVSEIGDVNGDGLPELAIVRNLVYDQGAELDIIDVKNPDEPYKQITIQKMIDENNNDWWRPGIFAEKVYSDDNEYIIAASVILGGDDDTRKPVLYFIDILNETVTARFEIPSAGMESLGENRVMIDSAYGGAILLDTTNSLKIVNLKDGEKINSPFKLKWEKRKGYSISVIKLNKVFVKRSINDEEEIELPAGKHVISVENEDIWGKKEIVSLSVVVEKENQELIRVVIYLIIALALLIIPKILKLIKKFVYKR
jgi:hypothetical protein